MRILRTCLKTLLVPIAIVVLGSLAFAFSGVYNVAATDHHWPATYWLLNMAKERSIEFRSQDIRVPEPGGREQLLAGAAAYDEMCSHCHTPPGGDDTPVTRGLYPAPPDLAHPEEEMSATEIFWVIKNGIKASGMPAWGVTHDDGELWSIVVLVQRLPELDAEDYRRLLEAARAEHIGHHGGDETPPDHHQAEHSHMH